ncbi:MAG: hypothetical protein Q6366_006400, partial [Candidatus Freyarchaeota archaeon]
DYTLILNKNGECLGFGLVKQLPQEAEKGVVVKNILDLGDFLRREQKQNQKKPKNSKSSSKKV